MNQRFASFKKDMESPLFNQIYTQLTQKYGHLDLNGMMDELKKDGFGELVKELDLNQDLIDEFASNFGAGSNGEVGIMPTSDFQGIPLTSEDMFKFEQRACLERCSGDCCKHKNYLMITLSDIHNLISSPGAEFFGIHSTRDLFEGKPPLLEIFFNEEYQLSFPYIRYKPVGTDDLTMRPEDAPSCVCPFLRPIKQVFDFHKQEVPSGTCAGAMGCMLMKFKPQICRHSPLGRSTGLETGKVSYEYAPPSLDCPACQSDIKVRVSDYMESVDLPHEAAQQKSFHRILMQTHKKAGCYKDRDRFIAITLDIYNIDGLLARHGFGPEHRPSLNTLTEIYLQAAKGNFSEYETLLSSMSTISGNQDQGKHIPFTEVRGCSTVRRESKHDHNFKT